MMLTRKVLCCLVAATLVAAACAQTPQESGSERESPQLKAAASTPGRAAWEPLPLLAGRTRYLPLIKRALQDSNPNVRRRALFVAGCVRDRQAIAPVRHALQDRDRLVRMQAAVALAALGEGEGLSGATVALREGPEWLRLYALEALWRLNSAAGRAALRGSNDYLSPPLQSCLKQALCSAPEPLRIEPVAAPLPPSQYDLWLEVADAFILESDYWWHEGNYDQCIRCQQTSLFFDPANVDAWTNVAWLQWSMGREGEAIRTYRLAIAANPRDWEAAQALGHYYWDHHQREAAVGYLQQAAKLGSPPIPRRALGHALEALGRCDEAKQVWLDILKLDPTDPIAKRQLERMKGN